MYSHSFCMDTPLKYGIHATFWATPELYHEAQSKSYLGLSTNHVIFVMYLGM
jgi:hypothetical protein